MFEPESKNKLVLVCEWYEFKIVIQNFYNSLFMLFLTSKKLETAKFRCKMQILERLRKLNIQYIQAFYLNSKFQLKNQNLFIGLKLSWTTPAVLNQKCKVILSNRFLSGQLQKLLIIKMILKTYLNRRQQLGENRSSFSIELVKNSTKKNYH